MTRPYAEYSWTMIPSGAWTHRRDLFRGGTVLRSLQQVYGSKKIPQGEGNSSIVWGDNQGPVVMVWDGMLPGEQENAKKIITDEDYWII